MRSQLDNKPIVGVFSLSEKPLLNEFKNLDFIRLSIVTTDLNRKIVSRELGSNVVAYNNSEIINFTNNKIGANVEAKFDSVINAYKYNEQMLTTIFSRRNNSGDTTIHEYRIWIINVLDLCMKILLNHNINLAIFHMIPHEPVEYAMYCCVRQLGIRYLMINVTIAPSKAHFLCHDINNFYLEEQIDSSYISEEYEQIYNDLIADEVVTPYYEIANHRGNKMTPSMARLMYDVITEKIRQKILLLPHVFGLLSGQMSNYNMMGTTIGRKDSVTSFTKSKSRLNDVTRCYSSLKYLVCIEKNDVSQLSNNKYVYLPMHYQPEATTAPMGGIWENQYFLIKYISTLLPDNYLLVVREHPSQYRFKHGSARPISRNQTARSAFFYRCSDALSNVVFISRNVSNTWLIDHAEIICTVTGTAGLEGYARGRKVAIFGDGCWYKDLDGIHLIKNAVDFKCVLESNNASIANCRKKLLDFLRKFDRNTFRLYQHEQSQFTSQDESPTFEWQLKNYISKFITNKNSSQESELE